MDTSGETHCRGALTSCVDAAVEHLLHILEELGLCSAGVSEQKAVNVTSDAMLAINILGFSSEHGECECTLHVLVPIDRWCD
jgi:hypothetical protein